MVEPATILDGRPVTTVLSLLSKTHSGSSGSASSLASASALSAASFALRASFVASWTLEYSRAAATRASEATSSAVAAFSSAVALASSADRAAVSASVTAFLRSRLLFGGGGLGQRGECGLGVGERLVGVLLGGGGVGRLLPGVLRGDGEGRLIGEGGFEDDLRGLARGYGVVVRLLRLLGGLLKFLDGGLVLRALLALLRLRLCLRRGGRLGVGERRGDGEQDDGGGHGGDDGCGKSAANKGAANLQRSPSRVQNGFEKQARKAGSKSVEAAAAAAPTQGLVGDRMTGNTVVESTLGR
ncbi:hypothetical protein [Streptomyces sp. NPDC059743]|uniref:hypothetical protein n=1 Tax=Streptomyces sp. NPDC059743 TaxID=3346928 RepID=UPI00365045FF